MSGKDLIEKASKLKIAVIGDLIRDEYIYGEVSRISPEAPVVVLNKTSTKSGWGGAGNVKENLSKMGVDAYLFTTGNIINVDAHAFTHTGKRIPTKTRIMSGNHHLIRIDDEDAQQNHEYDDIQWRHDFETLFASGLDCVVFADYHKGTISHSIAQTIIMMCNDNNIPVIVDAKKDFEKYNFATIIKCNQKESHNLLMQLKISSLDLRAMYSCKYFVITMGETGISIFYKEDDVEDGEGFDGVKVDIVDVCGAGDTVTAIIAIAYASGLSISQACEFANIAAAEVCRHPGVYPITKEDILRIC